MFFRLLLSIPHIVWLILWGIAVFFALIAAWFAALFAGRVPGSLHRCLGAFATRGVNLSRLESRPARTARWEYDFWVDIDADAASPTCAAAIDELRSEAQMVRVVGSYERAAED